MSHVPEAKCLAEMKAAWDASGTSEQIHANALKELSSLFLLLPLGFGYKWIMHA